MLLLTETFFKVQVVTFILFGLSSSTFIATCWFLTLLAAVAAGADL